MSGRFEKRRRGNARGRSAWVQAKDLEAEEVDGQAEGGIEVEAAGEENSGHTSTIEGRDTSWKRTTILC